MSEPNARPGWVWNEERASWIYERAAFRGECIPDRHPRSGDAAWMRWGIMGCPADRRPPYFRSYIHDTFVISLERAQLAVEAEYERLAGAFAAEVRKDER